MNEIRERRLLALASVMVLLAMAPLPARSPDGLEMLALARDWMGQGPPVDSNFWSPLWPALVALWLPLVEAERAAWLLNLSLAGLVAWPLHLGATRLGSIWAGRAAVFFWALAPVVRDHACILDARPLGWLLTALTVAFAIDAAKGDRAWTWAFGAAALAPLARPEGLALLPILTVSALLLRRRHWRRIVPLAVGAFLPTLVDSLVRSGDRGTLTGLWTPWAETWAMTDYVALIGIASAPTEYRAFLLGQIDAGVESTPGPSIPGFPVDGALYVLDALILSVGITGLVAFAVGAVALVRKPRSVAILGMSLSPLAALALTPMLQGQASPAANVGFLVAPLVLVACAGAVALVRRTDRITLLTAAPVVVGFAMLAETSMVERAPPDTLFVEDSVAADVMARYLRQDPPRSGRVACTLASRGVVQRAGLIPVPLGSTWEDWAPDPDDGVLLSSVDLYLGEDGGRGLELLEDPEWTVTRVFADGHMDQWRRGGWLEDQRMFVYLSR